MQADKNHTEASEKVEKSKEAVATAKGEGKQFKTDKKDLEVLITFCLGFGIFGGEIFGDSKVSLLILSRTEARQWHHSLITVSLQLIQE